MKKRKYLLLTTAIMVLGLGSITVNAQPKTMPDGNVFDAEFYASTYADVKAAFGTDEKKLYQHYLDFGAAEGRMAVASEQPPVTVSKVSAPGSVDLTQSGLAGQAASINQQLAERVPSEYGSAFVNMNKSSIEYAAYSGGAGSYTMQLISRSDLGHWDLYIGNRLTDNGDGFSAVADINCLVLKGMCNAICATKGIDIYNVIYNSWAGPDAFPLDEWKQFDGFQIMPHNNGGQFHYYIK